jgi:hypothetical protein
MCSKPGKRRHGTMKIFITDISASTGRNDLICGFGMVTCTLSPLSRFTAHLLPVYISNIKSFLPVEADISVTKVDGWTDRQDDCNIAPSL